MKYVLKHKPTKYLGNMNMFLRYFSNTRFKHYVFRIEDATHFVDKKRAKNVQNTFTHPDFWEIVEVD